MGKRKTVKRILLVVLALLALFLLAGFLLMRSVLYPKALVIGNGETKVACVGDSITYSQGVLTSRKTDAYPSVLAKLLGEEYQTVNYGLCNRTLLSTGNMPYFQEKLAEESLASEADIVIFMLGTNDSKPGNWDAALFKKEYEEAIDSYLQMDSRPDVYVMIPPRVFLEETGDGNCSDNVVKNEVAEIVKEAAKEKGVTLIDLYTLTEDHPEWFDDGLHPDREGNRAIAECIYTAITKQGTNEK